jgi:N-acetylglucosaminyl-diphospho-decaprenol L-rhamnosyltransferase
MSFFYNKLTIFMIAYHSDYSFERIIKKINPKIKIIIIENSNLSETKTYFERKYKNVKVILCRKNLGVTGAMNLAFKIIKTKFSIYLDMDIDFKRGTIEKFITHANEIKKFSFLVPNLYNSTYAQDFYFDNEEKRNNYVKMKLAHFHFVFFNMHAVKKIGLYDTKIFFYYDETDYCLRALKKNYNIYLIKSIKVKHFQGKSYIKNNQNKFENLRQWHLMWSKFYFYKKHYGLINAYYQTSKDLISSFLKMIIFFLFSKNKFQIHQHRLSGLINSMLGKKSWKRVQI